MRHVKLLLAAAAGAAAVSLSPAAQAAYPDKAINFIVPFGAGGSFDTLARKLAQRWEKEFKVPIVVKSQPGSGGRRGSISVFKSKPDGYTIGWTHFVPFLSDAYLRGKKGAIDYRKVAIIYQVSHDSNYVFVSKKSPIKSIAGLKKAGRTIKFTATGIGAVTWVEANALSATVGFPVSFVLGYKKLGDAALATAKGDAEAGIGAAAHFRAVKDDLRPIMFFGAKRDHFYPDVPSAKELGYEQLSNLGSPRVLTAPPGTPEARLKVIREATIRAVNDPAFVKWATGYGFTMMPAGPDETWKRLAGMAKIFQGLKPLVDKATKGKKNK